MSGPGPIHPRPGRSLKRILHFKDRHVLDHIDLVRGDQPQCRAQVVDDLVGKVQIYHVVDRVKLGARAYGVAQAHLEIVALEKALLDNARDDPFVGVILVKPLEHHFI